MVTQIAAKAKKGNVTKKGFKLKHFTKKILCSINNDFVDFNTYFASDVNFIVNLIKKPTVSGISISERSYDGIQLHNGTRSYKNRQNILYKICRLKTATEEILQCIRNHEKTFDSHQLNINHGTACVTYEVNKKQLYFRLTDCNSTFSFHEEFPYTDGTTLFGAMNRILADTQIELLDQYKKHSLSSANRMVNSLKKSYPDLKL